MIRLRKLNVVKEVITEEAAQKLISQGFVRIEKTTAIAPAETTAAATEGTTSPAPEKLEEKGKGKVAKEKNPEADNGGGENAAGTDNQDSNGGKAES